MNSAQKLARARIRDIESGRPARPRLSRSQRRSPRSQRVRTPVRYWPAIGTGSPVAHCHSISGRSTPECTAFSIVPASRALTSISNGRPSASRRNSTSHTPSRPIAVASRTAAEWTSARSGTLSRSTDAPPSAGLVR